MSEEWRGELKVALEALWEKVKEYVDEKLVKVRNDVADLHALIDELARYFDKAESTLNKVKMLETTVNDLLNYYKKLKDQINRLSLRVNLLQANIAKMSKTTGGRPNED